MIQTEAEAEAEAEAVEELLRKIQKLEQDHANLTQEIIANQNNKKNKKNSNNSSEGDQYENMLQSMGQSVYMFDVNNRIIYWNRMSEHLYGYTVEEALGKTAPDIIIEARYSGLATLIIQRAVNGETWSGQFPVRSKCGDTFSVITTLAPCRDQNGTTFGVTCVCTDTRQFPRQAHHHFHKLLPPCSQSDIHIQNLDVEISWDDLIIQEQIGTASHGSTGTLVYHALLYGSDVAVKIFTHQEYPHDVDVDVDVILSFRKEVCLMKRLRHPNILLFMGAVISPQCLCIVTEFLSRGSLFSLLQRNTTKLDWRRRLLMAMDIARGMNYLHNCQPPIVHRNLKSSNLLIDKNWAVKVGDFGLSRIKHASYLAAHTGTGTPHWMAPEILRNEQVDEKSDVYSYGVVLWEFTTGKIPWENLNAMQVIGGVGFMNERLEIPDDVDPQWASLIESCWSSEARSRPTFEEILIKLKDLQRKFSKGLVAKKG